MTTYPVVIVEAGDDYMEAVRELAPAATMRAAIEAAECAGYEVLATGAGGKCETTDAWDHARTVHVVTVAPPRERG